MFKKKKNHQIGRVLFSSKNPEEKEKKIFFDTFFFFFSYMAKWRKMKKKKFGFPLAQD